MRGRSKCTLRKLQHLGPIPVRRRSDSCFKQMSNSLINLLIYLNLPTCGVGEPNFWWTQPYHDTSHFIANLVRKWHRRSIKFCLDNRISFGTIYTPSLDASFWVKVRSYISASNFCLVCHTWVSQGEMPRVPLFWAGCRYFGPFSQNCPKKYTISPIS